MLPDFSKFTVIVVGDVMLDLYWMGSVKRLSPEAPVPVVHVTEKSGTLGGAGNAARNLAGLGCDTILYGIKGTDANGDKLSLLLDEDRITDRLFTYENCPTITKTRILGQGQQLLRIDEEKAGPIENDLLKRLAKMFGHDLEKASAVILSDYGKGVLCDHSCRLLIEMCKKAGVPVFVDPKSNDWNRYRNATCITPNRVEFENAAGFDVDSLEKMPGLLSRYGFSSMLVTLGSKGLCMVLKNRKPVIIPAKTREVYDVSGAGDTVIATMAAAVAAGLDEEEAARIANTAAGIVVGKLGTQPVTAAELESVLETDQGETGHARSKTATMEAARILVKSWKAAGEKVVFTNGCFDLLHPGHISLLHKAKALGDRLVVGLNTDSSIKQIKSSDRPILNERDRAALLSALECVDLVVLFDEKTPLKLIESFKPDILVKGADYRIDQVVGKDIVISYGGRVVLVPLKDNHSTSRIIDRLKRL